MPEHQRIVFDVDTERVQVFLAELRAETVALRTELDRRQALLDRELKHLKVRVWSSITIGAAAVAVVAAAMMVV